MKILGVILARGGSKSIHKKNICDVRSYPLISYTIFAALESKYIDTLIVSTDDEEIATTAKIYGANVPFMRPEALSGDLVTSADALRHAVLETERIYDILYDYVIELPCVAPLRTGKHIDEAIEKIIACDCDSVISMACTGEKHPIRLKKIINDQIVDFCNEYPEPKSGTRRQDLKPDSYIRNGAIYLMKRDVIVNQKNRHGEDSRPYIMDPAISLNIDEPQDLSLAEFLIDKGLCNNFPGELVKNIVVTTPLHFMEDCRSKLREIGNCTFIERPSKEEFIKNIKNAHILVTQPCPKFTLNEETLGQAEDLYLIATTSTGTNHIDKEYCEAMGIDIVCLRDNIKTQEITASSEFTFCLILSLVRKVRMAIDSMNNSVWREAEDWCRGYELAGKTLGIIGFGRIGSNNARYAHAFNMGVIAYDPYVVIDKDYVVQKNSYSEVLKEADIVMVSVHLNNETRSMVSSEWFDMMKKGTYFINTSRGEIVDESALLRNLQSGKLAGAGVDVITDEFESDKSKHPLVQYARQHTNLLLTPHIAGITYDSERKAALITIENIENYIKVNQQQ